MFDCVSGLGQTAANSAFQAHWARWITEDDIATMSSYGLNTIRIPVGYWMDEDIVYTDSEYFPQGGQAYLEQVCGWASEYGFYIIIDLHGAPGAQVAEQPFTGQYASTAGFYQDYQYSRAYSFLSWMANLIHTKNNFRNVGMLEVVNEPISGESTLISEYYPNAYSAIRDAESSLSISSNNYLHIQFMDTNWGAGDPNADLSDTYFASYDNHQYPKYDSSITPSQSNYLDAACSANPASDGDTPLIIGEWCISPATDVQDDSEFEISDTTNTEFYQKWFAAQATTYESQLGWIFWSWKAQLDDYRWSYVDAVAAGVIPTDLDDIYDVDVC
ncbi:hypothetical protein UCRPC4_g06060 [Phaeomoniella chlamydospora]|uniref:glucan endo-1,6-beta-glucosidase n=1 Tax=Phaeomoniella chlamydospora TaxID=158046 RepID=A0A0G2DZA3_PHACM|nr:hypothetical protein UCRPC4_g06060 [Phaeomoniella chlamydospora]